jgi:hypothetical protein
MKHGCKCSGEDAMMDDPAMNDQRREERIADGAAYMTYIVNPGR